MLSNEAITQRLDEGKALIEDARKILRHARLLVNSRVEEGNTANEIVAEAERGQYDLVVLGSTGNRDVKPDDGKRFFQGRLGSAIFRSDRPGTGRDRLGEGR